MKDTLHKFLNETQIQGLLKTLADKIEKEYAPIVTDTSQLVVVVTLKGAILFASDLVRYLKVPLRMEFVRAASYGHSTVSSGRVELLKDLEISIKDRHVLILDEIVDTGQTIDFLLKRWTKENPASLKVCTLLNKPSRRIVDVKVDYVGMDVEDKFLVGYGLDFNEKYRNLRDIYYI